MSDIPEDIMKAAEQVAYEVSMCFYYENGSRELDHYAVVSAIERAILAERKRCAGIARELPLGDLKKTDDNDPSRTFRIGAIAQATAIATAIEKGDDAV